MLGVRFELGYVSNMYRASGARSTLLAAILVLSAMTWTDRGVRAQEGPAEVQALVERLQGKLDELGRSRAERDQALDQLRQQVERATGRLSGERETNDALRQQAGTLATERQTLDARIADQAGTADDLRGQVIGLQAELALIEGERDQAYSENSRLAGLTADLQDRVAMLERRLSGEASTAAGTDDTIASLQALIGGRPEPEALARDANVERLESGVASEGREPDADQIAPQREIERLNAEIERLRREAEDRDEVLRVLARRSQDERAERAWRADTMTAVASALGRPDEVRIEGDRLILSSGGLFEPGTATLSAPGRAELDRLARALTQTIRSSPPERTWLVQVGAHADQAPEPTTERRSAWGLSATQAVAVAEHLARAGVPEERLAAVGFGSGSATNDRTDVGGPPRSRGIELRLSQLPSASSQ